MTFDKNLVKKQTVNFQQINKTLEKSHETITSAEMILKSTPENSFSLSYESMLKTTLALMLARGYRPKTQLGHHKTLIEFARFVLKDKFSPLTATYDRMRKKRNKIIYDITSVSQTEATEAISVAKKYFAIVENKIEQDNPQQKLWKPKDK